MSREESLSFFSFASSLLCALPCYPSFLSPHSLFLSSLVSLHTLSLFFLSFSSYSPRLSLAMENFRREENFSPSSPSLATKIISVAREEFPLFLSSFLSSLLPHSPRLSLATEISVAKTSPFLPPHFFFLSFLLSPTISSPSFPSLATEINSVAQEEFSLLTPSSVREGEIMATENNSVASLLLATGRVTSPSPALFLSAISPCLFLSFLSPYFLFFRKEREERRERREKRD